MIGQMSSPVAHRLAQYQAAHRNPVNRFLHMLGIPSIMFGLIAWTLGAEYVTHHFLWRALDLALVALFVATGYSAYRRTFTVAWATALTFAVGGLLRLYASPVLLVALAHLSGLILAVVLACVLMHLMSSGGWHGIGVALLVVALWLLARYLINPWTLPVLSAVFFVGGWVLQIPGHIFFEKNRPKFMTSFFQAFEAAPLHVIDELIGLVRIPIVRP